MDLLLAQPAIPCALLERISVGGKRLMVMKLTTYSKQSLHKTELVHNSESVRVDHETSPLIFDDGGSALEDDEIDTGEVKSVCNCQSHGTSTDYNDLEPLVHIAALFRTVPDCRNGIPKELKSLRRIGIIYIPYHMFEMVRVS